MGFLKKLKSMAGSPSADLLQNGLLGRGTLLGIETTRVATGPDGFEKPVCIFTVEVTLDNRPTYQATCRQAFPVVALAQLVPGQTVVAVRVDPNDQSVIAIDLATEPPTVTVKREGGGAADVLARGLFQPSSSRPSRSG